MKVSVFVLQYFLPLVHWPTSAPTKGVLFALPLQSKTHIFVLLQLWVLWVLCMYGCNYVSENRLEPNAPVKVGSPSSSYGLLPTQLLAYSNYPVATLAVCEVVSRAVAGSYG